MEILIAYLPALACAGATVLCFRMMGRHQPATRDEAAQRELSKLRRRLAGLEAERTANTEERING